MKNRFLSAALLAAILLSLCPPARAANDIEVIPCVYDSVGTFSEGLVSVERNGKWGYIDRTGAVVVPLKYDAVTSFSEGLAAVALDGKWGYVDKTGAEVVPPEYDAVEPFSKGFAAVRRNWRCGCINVTGAVAVPLEYDAVGSFSEGLAVARRDGKFGYIDTTGTIVVPLEYDAAGPFSEGLAAVRRNWKYGYIDKTGAVVVPLEYDGADSFSDGLARVERGGKFGYIDRTGRQAVSLTRHSANYSSGELDYSAVSDARSDWNTGGMAYARTQTVELDGKALTLSAYALKDEGGSETGYVRLRDVAYLLNGTAAAFNVEWDGAVNITTRTDYAPDGSELETPFAGDRAYHDSTAATRIDGAAVSLHAILLTDDNGGGYTYYKLSDLGAALGFTVAWNAGQGAVITTK